MTQDSDSDRDASTDAETVVTVNAETIPAELKDRDQWLMWDASADTPRRPHWRGDFGVGWNNPDDWHSFDEASEAAAERDSWGIGYVFARDNEDYARGLYGALDLDGCVDEEGRPKDWLPSLQPFFDEDAYTEFSPSGEGIHIPIVGFEPPDWWSNVHFDEGAHEGVEAYSSKFFTFTGDALRGAGTDVVDDCAAVEEWLIDAYTAIEGELPPPLQDDDRESDEPDKSRSEIEDLEETASIEDIYDAVDHLSEIDLSLSSSKTEDENPEWESWDPGYRSSGSGKSLKRYKSSGLFLDFAESDPKNCTWFGVFDIFAAEEGIISRPWDDLAGENWWKAVDRAREKGAPIPQFVDTSPPSPSIEVDETVEDADASSSTDSRWERARELFAAKKPKHARYLAAEALMDAGSWMYVLESERLWVYDVETGYFNRWGEKYATHVLERQLGVQYSRTDCAEIIDRIEARSQTHREDLDAGTQNGYYLCVGNGVVNLKTGDLQPHSPDFKFTRGLKWDYDPERADTEPIIEFLDDITKRQADRDTLLDHLSHGLMPGHPYRAFVMMYGPGANGKTQLGQIFRGFVGEDNAASVELQDLTGDDSFATGGLPGAFVNVGDDISVSEIRDVSILKSLTGSGTIRANEKYEKQYEFENEAAMFFSANEPPRIAEESAAVGDRLYPIEMPYRFVKDPSGPREKQKIPGIARDLLADEDAMRGLLLLCVEHAQRLIASNGQYSMPEGPSERRDMYEAASDPIRRFALEYLEDGEQADAVLKDDAFDVYKVMCEMQDERVASAQGFKRQITQQSIIDVESAKTRALTPGDGLDPCWRYVRFNNAAKKIMPERLIERYFPDEELDTDTARAESTSVAPEENDSSDRAVFGAEPIATAPESLTGFVTVTAEVAGTRRLTDDGRGVKAKLKDQTGGITAVVWDDDVADRLEAMEGQCIALKFAKVDEYDGTRQLEYDEEMTELVEIQSGVGYTPTPHAGSTQQLEAAADGGEQAVESSPSEETEDDNETAPDDSEPELGDLLPRALMHVRDNHEPRENGIPHDELVNHLTDHGASEHRAEAAIKKLRARGDLTVPAYGHYRTV